MIYWHVFLGVIGLALFAMLTICYLAKVLEAIQDDYTYSRRR